MFRSLQHVPAEAATQWALKTQVSPSCCGEPSGCSMTSRSRSARVTATPKPSRPQPRHSTKSPCCSGKQPRPRPSPKGHPNAHHAPGHRRNRRRCGLLRHRVVLEVRPSPTRRRRRRCPHGLAADSPRRSRATTAGTGRQASPPRTGRCPRSTANLHTGRSCPAVTGGPTPDPRSPPPPLTTRNLGPGSRRAPDLRRRVPAGRSVRSPSHAPTGHARSSVPAAQAREYFAVSGSPPCPRYSHAAGTTSSPSNPQRSSPGTVDSSQGSGTTTHSDATPDGHLPIPTIKKLVLRLARENPR